MINIRFAASPDEADMLDLIRAFPTPTPISADVYSRMFCRKLSDPFSFVAVAVRGDTLVGYISGHRHSAFYAAGDVAWVDEILVVDSARRQGIGRMLMSAFEKWATEAGCKLASLATVKAADFYRELEYSAKAEYFKKYLDR